MTKQQGGNGGAIKKIEPEPFLDMLKTHVGQIKAALPSTIPVDRMIRLATTEFRLQPKLKECVPASVFGAVVQASQLALDFSLRHCFLVPYKRTRKTPGGGWETWHECQLIISFQGYIELARRSGQLNDLDAHVVYENDEFDYQYGTSKFLKHRPTLAKRGKRLAAYAVANFRNGASMFDVMPWDEVDKIKERTKSRDSKGKIVGPWATDEDEMARKTAVRRLAKYLPLSVELARALDLEAAAAIGADQHLNNALEIIAQQTQGAYEPIPLNDDDEGFGDGPEDDDAGGGNDDQSTGQDESGEGSQAGGEGGNGEAPFDPAADGGKPASSSGGKKSRKRFTNEAGGETVTTGAAETKSEPVKSKTLYQTIRERLAACDSVKQIEGEAAGIRAIIPGTGPGKITEEDRAVLLATVGRRIQELS